MSKRDDVNKLYKPSQMIGTICKLLFWSNIVFSASGLFSKGMTLEVLSVLQIALAVAFVALSLIDDGVCWYSAECERRKNSIQEAFDIRLTENETEGYYNNTYSPSVLKYSVNTFESCFFSKNIAAKMLVQSAAKSLIALIILIAVGWVIADGSVLLIVTQAIFSAYIVEDTVLLAIYTNRMNKLYDVIYAMLITEGIHQERQIPILLMYCVEYESIKAHYKVRLDSKVFSKLNHDLSNQWNVILSRIDTTLLEPRI